MLRELCCREFFMLKEGYFYVEENFLCSENYVTEKKLCCGNETSKKVDFRISPEYLGPHYYIT